MALVRVPEVLGGASRWTPTIEEFQNAMDAKPPQRAHFKELRLRVIEPAVEELREERPACRWAPVKGEGMNITRTRP
jgi:hypothetical protein